MSGWSEWVMLGRVKLIARERWDLGRQGSWLGGDIQKHSLVASNACQEPTGNLTPICPLLLQRVQASSRGQAQELPTRWDKGLKL